ncbi:TRAP dicarboxylate transporter, DctQ subunit, unknown substrate 5 [hydrothermal vent metagenome]|uniref:Tripartite ATP-independent periplasmic transporters DctQ component domain-containing protein n=1 Tax=hydrothermal vent metagenome TaxID=652676 RepID=A0A160VC01_9ZZZZ
MSEVASTETAAADQHVERVLEGRSSALTLLTAMRAVTRTLDRVYLSMGYLCGMMFLLLALFITYQVIARKFNVVMAPGMDLMSGFTMAMASTWAFSYALRTGSHVRIDVLLPFMSPRVRWWADQAALASIVFFVSITAWKTWVMVLKSYEIGAVTNTYPLVPLWVPQTFVAIGFSMLAFTAIHMIIDKIAEATLPVLHLKQGGTESYRTVVAGTSLDPVLTEEQASGV